MVLQSPAHSYLQDFEKVEMLTEIGVRIKEQMTILPIAIASIKRIVPTILV